MRPLPPTQATFNNNAEYYRWLLNPLTPPLGLETFSVQQLSEMAEDASLTGSHGLNHSYSFGQCGTTCQFEAVMDSTRFTYVVGGTKEFHDGKFYLETYGDKVHLEYKGRNACGTNYGYFGSVFATVVARFGSVCETRYGLSERRCMERYTSDGTPARFKNDGAPLDMKECTEWIREKYGEECKCIVTLRAAVISQDQAKKLSEDIEVIKSIAQLAVVHGNRPFSRSTATSFDQLGTPRPESVASNITLTGTEYSDETGSSASFERLSMQQ